MVRKLRNIELNRPALSEYKAQQKAPLVVLLDSVRSMHNVGSVFRTADAFNVQSLYLCGITAIPPNKEIHKTALGSELSVEWKHYPSIETAIRELKTEGYTVAALEQTEGSIFLNDYKIEQNQKTALVVGNEIDGVSDEALALCDVLLEIPQYGTKHSLNVSVATALAIWEITKKAAL